MARYWSDGYKSTEQVGSPAETTVTMVDRVRWDNKQDPLVFDDHPVLGSESPVTSDGIARAIIQLQSFVKQKDVELCYIDVIIQDDEAVLREKTYIDIRDAYNNGKTLILRFVDSDDKCAYFYDFQGNVFRFVMFEVTDVLNMYTYWISPDDLLHTEQYSTPYKRPNPEVLSITYGDTSIKYDGSKHASVNIPKVPAWALGDTKPKYDASEVGAEAKGVAASRVNAHNNSDTAHADIRNSIANIMSMFNTYATTAQLNSVTQTVQVYASAVQTLRQDAVLHTEVVDDMYTNNSHMPLSAKQGMLLRTMYDALKPVHIGVTMWNGNSADTIPYYSTVPLANAVPCTDGGGRLSTNPPVNALHCATKKYVDDAILSSVVITEKVEGQIPVITDCAAVPPLNIIPYGKSEQTQLSGKQMLVYPYYESDVTINGCTFNGENGHFSVKGTSTSGVSFTLMKNIPVGSYGVKVSNVLKGMHLIAYDLTSKVVLGIINNNGSTLKMTFTVTDEMDVMLYTNQSDAGVVVDIDVDIMMTTSDLIDSVGFEPYTGGQPSPSMAYPQPIVSAGQRYITGAQLFDISKVISNEYVVNNGDGSLTFTGAYPNNNGYHASSPNTLLDYAPLLEVGKTYTLNAVTTASSCKYIYLSGQNETWVFGTSKVITEAILNSYVNFYSDDVGIASTISDIMLNEGTTSKPYEPYTGGVEKVIDVGIEQKLLSGNMLDIPSKALLDSEYYGINSDGSLLIKKQDGRANSSVAVTQKLNAGTYTVSVPEDEKSANLKVEIFDTINSSFLLGYYFDTSSYVTFTVASDTEISIKAIRVDIATEVSCHLMLNSGTEPLPFQPYTEKTLSIPYVLREGDKIPYAEGKLLRGSAEYVFTGEEDFVDTYIETHGSITLLFPHKPDVPLLYTHGIWKQNITWANDNYLNFDITRLGITTLEEFRNLLREQYNNGTPCKIVYQLADPIETDLTDEDIQAYNALCMNKGYNTLVNDAGCVTEVEYVVDPKLFITNNYVDKAQHDALAARVLVLEQHVINS